jgi:hypothetical protein
LTMRNGGMHHAKLKAAAALASKDIHTKQQG